MPHTRSLAAALTALALATACTSGSAPVSPAAATATAAPADEPEDQFTTVIPRTLDAGSSAVHGSDGKWHVVYEIEMTNAKPVPATLQEIRVLDAAQPDRVVATVTGDDLQARVRDLTGHTKTGPDVPAFTSRLVLMDLAFADAGAVPATLLHRFLLTGATITSPDKPGPLDYTGAPYPVSGTPIELGPPLRGDGWVAINGCCSSDSIHRNTVLPVNGHLSDTQRFAIDYMRLDAQGQLVHGDAGDVHNYTAYGAEIIAVADGTVVSTLDTLPDQKPGSLPDPATITLDTVDGNHVVLDLGGGRYAFFAHMQPGSVTVKPGDRVRRGQKLGLLGNTGNTSAPHLHFHIMAGPSVLGSNGLPYTVDAFTLTGQVPQARFDAATSLEGVWNQGMLPTPQPLTDQYPLDLNIVKFAD